MCRTFRFKKLAFSFSMNRYEFYVTMISVLLAVQAVGLSEDRWCWYSCAYFM